MKTMSETPEQMPDNATDQPLVTFALFAYNQEDYIREAIEGAFAQTYETLEIILSDDCSSDRTYQIMQEMAAAYEGPHEVHVQQNNKNLGLIDHVNKVSAAMAGEVLILAAGDDISLPPRTEKLMAAFIANPQAVLVHSSAHTIDETGLILGEEYPPRKQSLEEIVKSASIYIGATGAVRRCLFDMFEPIKYKATYEDLILGTRAALIGEIIHINESLIKYRVIVGIIFQSKNSGRRLDRRRKKIIHTLETLKQRQLDIDASNHSATDAILRIVDKQLQQVVARQKFYASPASFFYGFLGSSGYYHLKALSSETKYLMRLIK